MRIAASEGAEPDRGQPLLRARQRISARRTADLEPDRDIVDRGLPRKQRVGLEQVAGVTVQAVQRLVEDPRRSCGRFQQPRSDVEQRRLPASGRADNGDELAMINRKIGLLDRGINPPIRQPKRHRRTVKCDRRRLRHCHDSSPNFPKWLSGSGSQVQRRKMAQEALRGPRSRGFQADEVAHCATGLPVAPTSSRLRSKATDREMIDADRSGRRRR
ncbi:hypothetical protein chiPu_0028770, partial [Chiloscyllium punctatum]|nr:hypothetical protein [Chiloscyllium punctatum]